MNEGKNRNVLIVIPIPCCRAQECTSPLMVIAVITLHVACQRGVEWLTLRSDPVNNCHFQTLHVISSSTVHTLLQLKAHQPHCCLKYYVTHHAADVLHLFRRPFQEVIIEFWHHLKQFFEYNVFFSLSETK